MSWNSAPMLNGANWSGNAQLATKNQLLSSIQGIYNDIQDFEFSSITVANLNVSSLVAQNYIQAPLGIFSTIQANTISSPGLNIDASGVVIANVVSSQIANFGLTIVSSLSFQASLDPTLNASVDFGFGAALGGLLGGLGATIGGLFIGVGTLAGLTVQGITEGIGTIVAGRPQNFINSNIYEGMNYNTQIQLSTLGYDNPFYSSIFRTVSSVSANQVPGREIFISTIFPAGTKCMRSVSDPFTLLTSSTQILGSTIQAFGQWVPLQTELFDSISSQSIYAQSSITHTLLANKIGVACNSPQYTLDVNGTTNITGTTLLSNTFINGDLNVSGQITGASTFIIPTYVGDRIVLSNDVISTILKFTDIDIVTNFYKPSSFVSSMGWNFASTIANPQFINQTNISDYFSTLILGASNQSTFLLTATYPNSTVIDYYQSTGSGIFRYYQNGNSIFVDKPLTSPASNRFTFNFLSNSWYDSGTPPSPPYGFERFPVSSSVGQAKMKVNTGRDYNEIYSDKPLYLSAPLIAVSQLDAQFIQISSVADYGASAYHESMRGVFSNYSFVPNQPNSSTINVTPPGVYTIDFLAQPAFVSTTITATSNITLLFTGTNQDWSFDYVQGAGTGNIQFTGSFSTFAKTVSAGQKFRFVTNNGFDFTIVDNPPPFSNFSGFVSTTFDSFTTMSSVRFSTNQSFDFCKSPIIGVSTINTAPYPISGYISRASYVEFIPFPYPLAPCSPGLNIPQFISFSNTTTGVPYDIYYDFLNGVPDPKGTWIIELNGSAVIQKNSVATGSILGRLTNTIDDNPFLRFLSTDCLTVLSQNQYGFGAYDWFPVVLDSMSLNVSTVRGFLPNTTTGGASNYITFYNGTNGDMYLNSFPQRAKAYYYPFGVQ